MTIIKMAISCTLCLLILFATGCNTHDDPQEVASHRNLEALSLSLLQYAQDHHNRLPPLTDIQKLRKSLKPYIGPTIDLVTTDPISGRPYGLNSELSETNLNLIKQNNSIAVIFETDAASDGTHDAVLLAGPHVRRLKESQWEQVKPHNY